MTRPEEKYFLVKFPPPTHPRPDFSSAEVGSEGLSHNSPLCHYLSSGHFPFKLALIFSPTFCWINVVCLRFRRKDVFHSVWFAPDLWWPYFLTPKFRIMCIIWHRIIISEFRTGLESLGDESCLDYTVFWLFTLFFFFFLKQTPLLLYSSLNLCSDATSVSTFQYMPFYINNYFLNSFCAHKLIFLILLLIKL